MTFVAESITTFYDANQDRLNLIFNDKDKKQLLGLMTRQLLKSLLAQLPNWLTLQHRSHSIPQTAEQQWEINHMHHLISQQTVAVIYGKVLSDQQFESFLITTIHLAKGDPNEADQKIKLVFLNSTQSTEVILVLSTSRLHKFLGEILKQVRAWDIDNPWSESTTNPATISDTKGKIFH